MSLTTPPPSDVAGTSSHFNPAFPPITRYVSTATTTVKLGAVRTRWLSRPQATRVKIERGWEDRSSGRALTINLVDLVGGKMALTDGFRSCHVLRSKQRQRPMRNMFSAGHARDCLGKNGGMGPGLGGVVPSSLLMYSCFSTTEVTAV